jgi:hypothetical protein
MRNGWRRVLHALGAHSPLLFLHAPREGRTMILENHPHIMCYVFIAFACEVVYLAIYYGTGA